MTVTADIKFTQGPNTDIAGRAVKGTLTDGAVTVTNGDNTNVASWEIELLYVPPGSAVPTGVFASGISGTPSGNFTPDVVGCYRTRLIVRDAAAISDTDIRNFAVPNFRGHVVPPYQKNPDPIDLALKNDELNFNGQAFGWAGNRVEGLLEKFFQTYEDYSPATVTSTPYTVVVDTANIWLVNTTTIGGASVVNLPSNARSGQVFKIKDSQNDATAFPITVTLPGGHTFEDASNTYVIGEDGGAVAVIFVSGTSWRIIEVTSTVVGSSVTSSSSPTTDNLLVRMDGSGGSVIQDSIVTLSDIGDLSGAISLGLTERAGDPTTVANRGSLYTKDIATITELFYRDSAGSVIQVTSNGALAGTVASGTDNRLVRMDGTTGLQDSGITLSDTDNMSGLTSLAFGALPATAGQIRLPNGFTMEARNAANSSDLQLLNLDGSNNLIMGEAGGAASLIFDSAGAFNVRSGGATLITFSGGAASVFMSQWIWSNGVANPTISHAVDTSGPAGDTLTINSQGMSTASGSVVAGQLFMHGGDASGASSSNTGGSILIRGGTATNATSNTGGAVAIRAGTGATANGVLTIESASASARYTLTAAGSPIYESGGDWHTFRVGGANTFRVLNTQIELNVPVTEFGVAMANPIFRQASTSSIGTTGDLLTINAQDHTATSGANAGGATLYRGGDATGIGASSNTGGAVTIRGGDASGGTSNTGGDVDIRAGAGATANGVVSIRDAGNVVRATLSANGGGWGISLAAGGNATWSINSTIYMQLATAQLQLFNGTDIFWDVASAAPIIYQETNGAVSAVGETLLIHSQDCSGATSTGGDLSIRAGTGTTVGGTVRLQDPGGTERIRVSPNGNVAVTAASVLQLNAGGLLALDLQSSQAEFRTPVLRFDSTVITPIIQQEPDGTSTIGDQLTIHSQDLITATGSKTAGLLFIRGGDCSGGTSNTGGSVTIRPGTGATANGLLNLQFGTGSNAITVGTAELTLHTSSSLAMQVGGTTRATLSASNLNLNLSTLSFSVTSSAPIIYQETDGGAGASGDNLLIHAQDCSGTTSSGGDLILRPGSGTQSHGVFIVQDGGGGERLRINASTTATPGEFVLGLQTIRFESTVAAPVIYQNWDSGDDAVGDALTIEAQGVDGGGTAISGGTLRLYGGNASSGAATTNTGGDVHIKPGAGTGANHGEVELQDRTGTGRVFVLANQDVRINGAASDVFQVAGATRLTVTATDIDVTTSSMRWATNTTSPIIWQNDDSTTGDTFTIHAQNVTGSGTITGGPMLIYAGDASNAGTSNTGGTTTIRGGNAASATSNTGGDLVLRAGNGDVGQRGNILMQGGAGVTVLQLFDSTIQLSNGTFTTLEVADLGSGTGGQVTRILGNGGLRLESNGAINVETLAATKTLDSSNDPHYQKLNPNGSTRNVDLPTESESDGLWFKIFNSGGTGDLSVRNPATTEIAAVLPGEQVDVICDGTTWVAMRVI